MSDESFLTLNEIIYGIVTSYSSFNKVCFDFFTEEYRYIYDIIGSDAIDSTKIKLVESKLNKKNADLKDALNDAFIFEYNKDFFAYIHDCKDESREFVSFQKYYMFNSFLYTVICCDISYIESFNKDWLPIMFSAFIELRKKCKEDYLLINSIIYYLIGRYLESELVLSDDYLSLLRSFIRDDGFKLSQFNIMQKYVNYIKDRKVSLSSMVVDDCLLFLSSCKDEKNIYHGIITYYLINEVGSFLNIDSKDESTLKLEDCERRYDDKHLFDYKKDVNIIQRRVFNNNMSIECIIPKEYHSKIGHLLPLIRYQENSFVNNTSNFNEISHMRNHCVTLCLYIYIFSKIDKLVLDSNYYDILVNEPIFDTFYSIFFDDETDVANENFIIVNSIKNYIIKFICTNPDMPVRFIKLNRKYPEKIADFLYRMSKSSDVDEHVLKFISLIIKDYTKLIINKNMTNLIFYLDIIIQSSIRIIQNLREIRDPENLKDIAYEILCNRYFSLDFISIIKTCFPKVYVVPILKILGMESFFKDEYSLNICSKLLDILIDIAENDSDGILKADSLDERILRNIFECIENDQQNLQDIHINTIYSVLRLFKLLSKPLNQHAIMILEKCLIKLDFQKIPFKIDEILRQIISDSINNSGASKRIISLYFNIQKGKDDFSQVLEYLNELCSDRNGCEAAIESNLDELVLETLRSVGACIDIYLYNDVIDYLFRLLEKMLYLRCSVSFVSNIISLFNPVNKTLSSIHTKLLEFMMKIFEEEKGLCDIYLPMTKGNTPRITIENFDIASVFFSCWYCKCSDQDDVLFSVCSGNNKFTLISSPKTIKLEVCCDSNDTCYVFSKEIIPYKWVLITLGFADDFYLYVDQKRFELDKSPEFTFKQSLMVIYINEHRLESSDEAPSRIGPFIVSRKFISSLYENGPRFISDKDEILFYYSFYMFRNVYQPMVFHDPNSSVLIKEIKCLDLKITDSLFDVLIYLCEPSVLVPLFSIVDMEYRERLNTNYVGEKSPLDYTLDLFERLIQIPNYMKSFSDSNVFPILSHVLSQISDKNINVNLFERFIRIYENCSGDTKDQLLVNIILNPSIWTKSSQDHHKQILEKCGIIVRNSKSVILSSRVTIKHMIDIIEEYYTVNGDFSGRLEVYKSEIKVYHDLIKNIIRAISDAKVNDDDVRALMCSILRTDEPHDKIFLLEISDSIFDSMKHHLKESFNIVDLIDWTFCYLLENKDFDVVAKTFTCCKHYCEILSDSPSTNLHKFIAYYLSIIDRMTVITESFIGDLSNLFNDMIEIAPVLAYCIHKSSLETVKYFTEVAENINNYVNFMVSPFWILLLLHKASDVERKVIFVFIVNCFPTQLEYTFTLIRIMLNEKAYIIQKEFLFFLMENDKINIIDYQNIALIYFVSETCIKYDEKMGNIISNETSDIQYEDKKVSCIKIPLRIRDNCWQDLDLAEKYVEKLAKSDNIFLYSIFSYFIIRAHLLMNNKNFNLPRHINETKLDRFSTLKEMEPSDHSRKENLQHLEYFFTEFIDKEVLPNHYSKFIPVFNESFITHSKKEISFPYLYSFQQLYSFHKEMLNTNKKLWERLICTLTTERATWYGLSTTNYNVFYKRDNRFCKSFCPYKIRKNYEFNDHSEAFLRQKGRLKSFSGQRIDLKDADLHSFDAKDVYKRSKNKALETITKDRNSQEFNKQSFDVIGVCKRNINRVLGLLPKDEDYKDCDIHKASGIYGWKYKIHDTYLELVPHIKNVGQKKPAKIIYFEEITHVYIRALYHIPTCLELFTMLHETYFIDFYPLRNVDADKLRNHIEKAQNLDLLRPILKKIKSNYSATVQDKLFKEYIDGSDLNQRWADRTISTFDYLVMLNMYSSRSFNSASQYPIFPAIVEINEHEGSVLKDFSKLECSEFSCDYESLPNFRLPNEMNLCYYLVRLEPFTSRHIYWHDNACDMPSRIFKNISNLGSAANVFPPEFFFLPEFLQNHNKFNFGSFIMGDSIRVVDNVELPSYIRSPHELIYIFRRYIESDDAAKKLPEWIDMVWGGASRGKNAFVKFYGNIYPDIWDKPESYSKNSIEEIKRCIESFGHVPPQLFTSFKFRRNEYVYRKGFNCNFEFRSRFDVSFYRTSLSCDGKIDVIIGSSSFSLAKISAKIESSSASNVSISELSDMKSNNIKNIVLAGSPIAFSKRTNSLFVIGSDRRTLFKYDYESDKVCEWSSDLESHFYKIFDMCTDNNFLAVSEPNARIRVLRNGKIHSNINTYCKSTTCMYLSEDFDIFIFGTSDNYLVLESISRRSTYKVINFNDIGELYKCIITISMGYIVCCAKKHMETVLILISINGDIINKVNLPFIIDTLIPFEDPYFLDHLLVTTEDGLIFIYEAFTLKEKQKINVLSGFKIVHANIFVSYSIILSIIKKDDKHRVSIFSIDNIFKNEIDTLFNNSIKK